MAMLIEQRGIVRSEPVDVIATVVLPRPFARRKEYRIIFALWVVGGTVLIVVPCLKEQHTSLCARVPLECVWVQSHNGKYSRSLSDPSPHDFVACVVESPLWQDDG